MGIYYGSYDGAKSDSIIGFYRFMLDLKLIDTYVPLIIPAIAAPTVVFFMKQYMESTLSLEMIEQPESTVQKSGIPLTKLSYRL